MCRPEGISINNQIEHSKEVICHINDMLHIFVQEGIFRGDGGLNYSIIYVIPIS